jgi:hypothetical protein
MHGKILTTSYWLHVELGNNNLRCKFGKLQVLPDVYRNVFYFILEVSCAS